MSTLDRIDALAELSPPPPQRELTHDEWIQREFPRYKFLSGDGIGMNLYHRILSAWGGKEGVKCTKPFVARHEWAFADGRFLGIYREIHV